MDALAPATPSTPHGLDHARGNEALREALDAGAGAVEVLHPGSRHNLAVGIPRQPGAESRFRGDVGYFCGGLSDGLDVHVDGNAGWSLGADMMGGRIVVEGNSGSSTGASMRGGPVVVKGDAGARSAIAGKGGTLVIGGSTGDMSGLHEPAHAAGGVRRRRPGFGDSMYEGVLYCGGRIDEPRLGHRSRSPDADELAWLDALCEQHGLAPARRVDAGALGREAVALRQEGVLGLEGGAVTEHPPRPATCGRQRRSTTSARRPSSAAT